MNTNVIGFGIREISARTVRLREFLIVYLGDEFTGVPQPLAVLHLPQTQLTKPIIGTSPCIHGHIRAKCPGDPVFKDLEQLWQTAHNG